jgi:acyl-CoA thioester hydrolase
MPGFRFFHPVEVRYGDVDAQRHVNNVAFFRYMEMARGKYLEALGLWDGIDFDSIGIILVEASCTYKAPIRYGQKISVGVCTSRLGNKSFTLEYSLRDSDSGAELAAGRTVQVSYDYREQRSLPLGERWRERIREYEGLA